jgi:hypothetical protein
MGLMLLVLGQALLSAQDVSAPAHSFQLKLDSKIDMDVFGKKQAIIADTDIRYTWRRKGKERTVNLDLTGVKVVADGKVSMDVTMSRERVVNRQGDKTNEVKSDDAPEELKKMLRDSFGVPLCKIEVDKDGKRVKRTDLAGAGAKLVTEQGLIANTLLFHAPHPAARDQWEADAEISMGNGGYAKGKLTYKKAKDEKGRPIVKVTGTLRNDSYQLPGQPVKMKEARYVVNGVQTYDPALGEWVAGKLPFQVSFKMVDATSDTVIASAKGTMVATLRRLPGKKK